MKIFFDMDGTLAKWHPEKSLEEISAEGYFASLEPQERMCMFVNLLSIAGYDVHILSCVLTPAAGEEKRDWLSRHCPYIPANRIHLVKDGSNKNLVPHNEEDILIDDYSKNLHEWSGRAVKCLNGINGTHGTWKGAAFHKDALPSEIWRVLAAC